jgi:hypothetical protein
VTFVRAWTGAPEALLLVMQSITLDSGMLPPVGS